MEQAVDILNLVCYLVTIASVVVRFTPSKTDDKVVALILNIVKKMSIPPKDEVK